MARFRILFVSDLHGSEGCFRKFVNSAPVYRPDLLVYGGDLLGKTMVPLFPDSGGGFHWYPTGTNAVHGEATEREAVERRLADQGRYSIFIDPTEWARLQRDRGQLESICLDLARQRFRSWLGLVRERLEPKGLPVVMNVGNDDTNDILDILRKESPKNVLVPEGGVISAGPYEIFGCGYANMTPWHCPRDVPETQLDEILEKTGRAVGASRRTIFDIHAPPFDTAIDLAPELDADLRPRTAGGEMLYGHVGSPSVRSLIERIQPVLSLHGHIHESRGTDRIGSTPIFNPGSVYFSGQLQGLLIDLEGAEVVSHLFVTG